MNAALLLATGHDPPTEFVRATAAPLAVYLPTRGLGVLPCLRQQARADEVYAQLRLRRARDLWRFQFAYCCAHGSHAGLHDANGDLVLEKQACCQFDDAVFVLNSCMGSGQFPRQAVTVVNPVEPASRPVRAVIYYQGKLFVPSPALLARCSPDAGDLFQSLLAYPAFLLLQGRTVEDTVELLRSRWYTLEKDTRQHQSFRDVCRVNGDVLAWAGDPFARLTT